MNKDAAMNIRINSQDLARIKKTAKSQGYSEYSKWCLDVLLNATGKRTLEQELEILQQRVEKLEQKVV